MNKSQKNPENRLVFLVDVLLLSHRFFVLSVYYFIVLLLKMLRYNPSYSGLFILYLCLYIFLLFQGKLTILLALVGVAYCQYENYAAPNLAPTNYQTADSGRQEAVDQQGNIQGQYSYVDPNGKTITVKYTAGTNGFQVQGDHLPVAPQGYAPQPQQYAQQPQGYAPQPQGYAPQPKSYVSQGLGSYQSEPSYQNYDEQDDGSYHEESYQSHVPQSYQQYNQIQPGFQSRFSQPKQPSFQSFAQPSKSLFTPSHNDYPAASTGQYDNYKKALEEEREEAQKSFDQSGHRFGAPVGAPEGIPQTPYSIQYGADNGFSFEYSL